MQQQQQQQQQQGLYGQQMMMPAGYPQQQQQQQPAGQLQQPGQPQMMMQPGQMFYGGQQPQMMQIMGPNGQPQMVYVMPVQPQQLGQQPQFVGGPAPQQMSGQQPQFVMQQQPQQQQQFVMQQPQMMAPMAPGGYGQPMMMPPPPSDGWWATPGFNAQHIAGQVRLAMDQSVVGAVGVEDHKLLVLCTLSPTELAAVRSEYQRLCSKDLLHSLKKHTHFNFSHSMCGLFKEQAQRDAEDIHRAYTENMKDDYSALEILVSRSYEEKQRIGEYYQREFGNTLHQLFQVKETGNVRHLLQMLLQIRRDNEGRVDEQQALSDARVLYNAGEGKVGTDDMTFVNMFVKSSNVHLRSVATHYQQSSKKHHTLFQAIDSEFSFGLKFGLHAILTVAVYGELEFQVDMVHKAMKGLGTNDTRLIRVLLNNRKYIGALKAAYARRHSKTLRDYVHSETSGSYRNALLAILDHDHQQ